MEKIYLVYVTTPGQKEAEEIGRAVVSKRLAACANVVPGICSIYWWEESLQHDQEAVLILKTKETRLDALEKAIKETHTYKCPCIVAIPIHRANAEYAAWVERETS